MIFVTNSTAYSYFKSLCSRFWSWTIFTRLSWTLFIMGKCFAIGTILKTSAAALKWKLNSMKGQSSSNSTELLLQLWNALKIKSGFKGNDVVNVPPCHWHSVEARYWRHTTCNFRLCRCMWKLHILDTEFPFHPSIEILYRENAPAWIEICRLKYVYEVMKAL